MSRATSSTLSSTGLPRLIGPDSLERASASSPATVSLTWQTERVCRPEPLMVSGSPASAWVMKAGIIRPSSGRIRGP